MVVHGRSASLRVSLSLPLYEQHSIDAAIILWSKSGACKERNTASAPCAGSKVDTCAKASEAYDLDHIDTQEQ